MVNENKVSEFVVHLIVVFMATSISRNGYSFASNINPQRMFMTPRKPMTPIDRGSENKNGVEVRMPYKEKRESKAPTAIIKLDKSLPTFSDALKTSSASTLVVSSRSASFRFLKDGEATTISFLFLFFDISSHK